MYDEDHAPVTLNLTLGEIYNQAASCQQTVARASTRSRIFERFLPLSNYTDIVITGCGSSHHLAICASFAWSEMLERPVAAIASSELAHFPEHYLRPDAKPLVIAISRSGDTTEVKLAVDRLRADYKAASLAITTEGYEVANACSAGIVFDECLEQSVVMTQAFTCILVGLYLLVDDVTGGRQKTGIIEIPRLIDDALQTTETRIRPLAEDQNISRFFFLGSGAMKGLADECALKLTEMALDTAFSYRTLEFRHGPKATLNSTDQVVIFPVDAERPYLDTLIAEITATGAQVFIVGGGPQQDGGRTRLTVRREELFPAPPALADGAELSERFHPALYAHIGQLLAYWRAAARDLNPDAPRHLARTVLLEV
jgi:glucosamine--fructose-6-phosphate aminotransferase (isomerizing)